MKIDPQVPSTPRRTHSTKKIHKRSWIRELFSACVGGSSQGCCGLRSKRELSPREIYDHWNEIRDMLSQRPNNYFRLTYEDQQLFMEHVNAPGFRLNDLLARACWTAPVFAILLVRKGVDVNAPEGPTGLSPLFIAVNSELWRGTLVRELLQQGAQLNDRDLMLDEYRLQHTAYTLSFNLGNPGLKEAFSNLSDADQMHMIRYVIQATRDRSIHSLDALLDGINFTAPQALVAVDMLQEWLLGDSERVQHLFTRLDFEDQMVVAEVKPNLYFHLTNEQQTRILRRLIDENKGDPLDAILPNPDWFLNHNDEAHEIFSELEPSEVLQVLDKSPQLWKFLTEDQHEILVDAISGVASPTDLLLAFGRNPLAWEVIFSRTDPDKTRQALASRRSPFRRLKEVDEEAFEKFQIFLQESNKEENSARIHKYFALGPEIWKLWIDHAYHHFGPNTYDHGIHGGVPEFGYLHGMEAAAAWLCSLINEPQTAEEQCHTYLTAHSIIMAHDPDHDTAEHLREPMAEAWHKLTDEEYEDYLENKEAVDIELDTSILEVNHETREIHFLGREDIVADLTAIFRDSRLALAAADSADDRLRAIAWKFQQLERLNAHSHGNSRANILTLITDLVEYGFEPCLLKNLNEDAYLCTLDTMVEHIKYGIEQHRRLTEKESED